MNIRKIFCLVILILVPSFIPANSFAEAMTITSWNMEWLASTPSSKIPASQRHHQDIQALKQLFGSVKPSIFSFQEVNDVNVLNQIVGHGYTVLLSDRAQSRNRRYQFSQINQYTGIAIADSIRFSDPKDIVLTPGSKLRFATYIIAGSESERPLHILAVHLKAGCITLYKPSSTSCATLKQQAHVLNRWIKQQEKQNHSYIIMGDFNHNLAYSRDWMWQQLTDNINPAPQLVTRSTKPECQVTGKSGKTFRYRYLIDHIVVSHDIAADNAQQIQYPRSWLGHYRLSDHCPVSAVIRYETVVKSPLISP